MHRGCATTVIVLWLAGCAAPQPPPAPQQACVQVGLASWYRVGARNGDAMVAAHRTLPFGTQVRVTDVDSGRSGVVRIRDRGPFIKGRIIDLSAKAATQLGIRRDGVSSVRVEPYPADAAAQVPGSSPSGAWPLRAGART